MIAEEYPFLVASVNLSGKPDGLTRASETLGLHVPARGDAEHRIQTAFSAASGMEIYRGKERKLTSTRGSFVSSKIARDTVILCVRRALFNVFC